MKPCLFLTFSAADLQWYDMQRVLPRFDEYAVAEDRIKRSIAWDNIRNQPHLVSEWLVRRFQHFQTAVLKPLFGYTDSWFRFEWQARGSGHMHGLIWLDDAPAMNISTEEKRLTFAEYWSHHISAVNPRPCRSPDAVHPSSLPFAEQVFISSPATERC